MMNFKKQNSVLLKNVNASNYSSFKVICGKINLLKVF